MWKRLGLLLVLPVKICISVYPVLDFVVDSSHDLIKILWLCVGWIPAFVCFTFQAVMFSNIHLRVYSVRVLCMGLMYMSVNHFTFKTCRHIVIQDEAPYLYAFFFISACLNKEWLMAALIFLACCWCCMTAWCCSCKTKATSPLKKQKQTLTTWRGNLFCIFTLSVRYCTAADAFTPSLIVPWGISCLLLLYFIFLILHTFIWVTVFL